MSNDALSLDPATQDAILDLLAREALQQAGRIGAVAELAASKARIARNPEFARAIAQLVAAERATLEGKVAAIEPLLAAGSQVRANLTPAERFEVDLQLVQIVARELPKPEAERLDAEELHQALLKALQAGADPHRQGVNPYDLAKRNNLTAAVRVLEELGLNAPPAFPQTAPAPIAATHPHAFEAIEIDATGEIVARQPRTATTYEEDLGNGIKLVMVAIPGGSFWMGSPTGELQRRPNEGPRHRATLPEFYLGKYAVTQAQWQAIMESNPSKFKGDDRPVERVSWEECQEFCQRLTQRQGRIYRLPSEAEWEYACRGATETPFHFGPTLTTELANFNGLEPYQGSSTGEYRQQTVAVGRFPANGFWLCEMHGNVWERCQDRWHDNYDGAPTDGSAWQQGDGKSHVIRGGSWFSLAWGCRSACRDASDPSDRSYNVGFRIARSAPLQ